jgi:hypothetical protein
MENRETDRAHRNRSPEVGVNVTLIKEDCYEGNGDKILEFLKKYPRLVIPIYQRTCGWGERERKQLRDDVIRTGKDDDAPAHFVGSIVCVMSLIRQSFGK